MISFVKTPEINIVFPKSVGKTLKKNKKGGDKSEKSIIFSEHELNLIKKLENYEITPPKKVKEEEFDEEEEIKEVKQQKKKQSKDVTRLTLDELKSIRENLQTDEFLCDLLENAEVELPENEIVEGNPELEERIKKLKVQQENRVYKSMVRNVDSRLKQTDPEDSIAYQSE